jgi:predicted TIM-barrel fold metal-dependent hydrolase
VYTVGDETYLVVDAQVHIWDASPHNQAIPDGEVYALDLLRRHRELDGLAVPPHEVERVTEHSLNRDVFGDGHVDRAVLQPVVLGDLFVLGFSPLEWHAEMAGWMPDRFVLSGELDPGGGQPGARGLTPRVRKFDLRGLTLCERRRPAGRMHLADPWLRRVLTRCGQAGADVVHIGVGPSTRAAPWRREAETPIGTPLPRSSRLPQVPRWAEPVQAGSAQPVRAGAAARIAPPGFDARQFRDLARALPDIRFVLGAGCLPTEQLCRLAALPNVHIMLTEILPWTGSLDFAHAFGSLLAAFGAERLLFGSGYPMMRPGRLVQELATYRFPAHMLHRYPRFDAAAVRAVLGGNAARLYRVPLPAALPVKVLRGQQSTAGERVVVAGA